MATSSQDKAFAETMRDQSEVVISSYSLDAAIEWIRDNLNPDDVFHDDKLQSWAESNGYEKE